MGNAATAERVVGRVQITKYYYHGGQRVALRQGQALYFLHPDHLGSTSLTTDAAGNVVARRRYAPYGKERWVEGTLPTDFGFTGQRDVPGTGLMYYRARYYDPTLGRFISADTIVPNVANPQSLNRYSYVRNNPLKYTDLSGHWYGPDQYDPAGIENVREAYKFASMAGEFDALMNYANRHANPDRMPVVQSREGFPQQQNTGLRGLAKACDLAGYVTDGLSGMLSL